MDAQGRALTPVQLSLRSVPMGVVLGRVLVVEDNAVNRMVLRRQLEVLGYACDTADDGEQALARLATHHYDAILCDCQMPVMDGYAFAQEWRRLTARGERSATPLIACTARAMEEEIHRCYEAGMDDCLLKPVTMDRLREKLVAWTKPAGAVGHALNPRVARDVV